MTYGINTYLYIVCIKYRYNFVTYRLLAEWLGCYRYIAPNDRFISAQLPPVILAELLTHFIAKESAHYLSEIINIMDSTATMQEQQELIHHFTGNYYINHGNN